MEELLGGWLVTRRKIWQMELLSRSHLARFCRERGVDFEVEQITRLWQLGVLRADLVISHHRLRRAGLVHVGMAYSEQEDREEWAYGGSDLAGTVDNALKLQSIVKNTNSGFVEWSSALIGMEITNSGEILRREESRHWMARSFRAVFSGQSTQLRIDLSKREGRRFSAQKGSSVR